MLFFFFLFLLFFFSPVCYYDLTLATFPLEKTHLHGWSTFWGPCPLMLLQLLLYFRQNTHPGSYSSTIWTAQFHLPPVCWGNKSPSLRLKLTSLRFLKFTGVSYLTIAFLGKATQVTCSLGSTYCPVLPSL